MLVPTLSRSLAVRLLATVPLFLHGPVLAATIRSRHDLDAPKSVIAIKLDTSTLRTSQTGAEIVEGLVRNAYGHPALARRDVEFNVLPLITSLSSERIAEMVHRAQQLDPTYVPADFGSWFQVHLGSSDEQEDDDDIVELLSRLVENQEVASCQRLAGGPSPDVEPHDDPLFADQHYVTESAVGINAEYAWGFPGGDGSGTTIIDVERGWQLDHEDLMAAGIELLAGMNVRDRLDGNIPHGTAVLGEMLMVDNTIGGVGIVPSAQGHVVGIQRTVGGGPVENQPEAIMDAASFLDFGDAILLEMQTGDADRNLWPVEILDAEYDAIRLAVALGITVIEPAGNGGMDLNKPVLRPGETTPPLALLNRNSPDFRDSGAIMVGAASSALPRRRLDFSNYGNRVDTHSWGENILTTSVDPSNNYAHIYSSFSGTSGAAPIVAGAALSIQGMVNANRGSKLSPAALRELIVVGGSTTSDPAADMIGVQPDLRALIDGGHLE